MPDLPVPPDSSRGDRGLTEAPDPVGTPQAPGSKAKGRAAHPGSGTGMEPARVPGVRIPRIPVLRCQRVSKWYGPVIGVNQVTLELRGGITGLVGANGAGKSTLMRLITGCLRPDLGRVEVLGIEAWSARSRRHVGYCPEVDSFFEEMSGRQFVETMARLCGYPRTEALRRAGQALQRVDMAQRAERRLRGYSKGMRQRIKLAQALLHDPELLVLDEPLSGIDPVGRWEFIELFQELAQQGKCVLISSHELEELEKLTDHVAIMARGRIAAVGTVAQIRDRLDDHPLTVRVDIQKNHRGARELAAALLQLPEVVGIELLDEQSNLGEEPSSSGNVSRLLVRARHPQRFFQNLGRLVVEEWYELLHLEPLDDSTHAVLGYLLGG
jgi:ABC-2 type transport system ATP-binding protein